MHVGDNCNSHHLNIFATPYSSPVNAPLCTNSFRIIHENDNHKLMAFSSVKRYSRVFLRFHGAYSEYGERETHIEMCQESAEAPIQVLRFQVVEEKLGAKGVINGLLGLRGAQ